MRIGLLFLVIASLAAFSSCNETGAASGGDLKSAGSDVVSSESVESKEFKSTIEMEIILYENMQRFKISYVGRRADGTLEIAVNDEDCKQELTEFMEENDFDMDKVKRIGIVPNSVIDVAM